MFYNVKDMMYFCTMFKNKSIYGYLVILLMISSCSGYEKVLKSDDVEWKYQKAFEYYHDEDYGRAASVFEQLVPLMRGTAKSDSVNYFLARSYFGQRDYILAAHYFESFANIFANSEFAEDAEFNAAYCHYKNSPRPNLDQSETKKAIEAFQLFLIKYPYSDRKDECLELIAELKNKLVEKSYLNAKLYYDMGEYKASIIALNNSLIKYPETKYREELLFLILKSHYLLADNSVLSKKKERFQSTLDEYYSFISEFPESEYLKEANKIYQSTVKVLNIKEQGYNP